MPSKRSRSTHSCVWGEGAVGEKHGVWTGDRDLGGG